LFIMRLEENTRQLFNFCFQLGHHLPRQMCMERPQGS
nr:hypothetical protein [Tanacetum cinerariifolium]